VTVKVKQGERSGELVLRELVDTFSSATISSCGVGSFACAAIPWR
jgi:hypothetical protein